MIYCLPVEKAYIGQARNIHTRWTAHKGLLRRKEHENTYLQNLWSKYGAKCFVFYVLENSEDLTAREQYFFDLLDEGCRLNLRTPSDPSILAIETREKLRKKAMGNTNGRGNKGKFVSEETRMKLSEAHKGKKQSLETIQKRVNSRKGYRPSDETKLKISLAHKAINN